MTALIKINGIEARFHDGNWFCADQSLQVKLSDLCAGEYPGYEPDPQGRDLDLVVSMFNAEVLERTDDEPVRDIVY